MDLQYAHESNDRTCRQRNEFGNGKKICNALRELIANPNWQALFTFRIGYPTIETLSSPGRSVQEVTVSHI